MAKYYLDCNKCTNKAYSGVTGYCYCLPGIVDGRAPLKFHDMGKASLDYFTCDEYTTEPRTLAIYEVVANYDEILRLAKDFQLPDGD